MQGCAPSAAGKLTPFKCLCPMLGTRANHACMPIGSWSRKEKEKKRLRGQCKHHLHELRGGSNCLGENADAEPLPAAKVQMKINAGLEGCLQRQQTRARGAFEQFLKRTGQRVCAAGARAWRRPSGPVPAATVARRCRTCR